MALRDKLRQRVQPLLEPGEQIQSVFLAQTGPNPNLAFVTWLVFFWTKYHVIAITDRRIAAFHSGRWRPARPRELAASYPRETRLGAGSGRLWSPLELGGTRYWVHRRFRDDLRQADEAPATA